MSLRIIHLMFIIVVMLLADLMGIWAIDQHSHNREPLTLILGLVSFAIGLGLAGYALWFVRKADAAKLT